MVIHRNSIEGIDEALATPLTPAHYLRIVAAIVVGACCALSLAFFMVYLIKTSDLRLEESSRIQMLDFVRIKREEAVERKDRTPPKPQLNETPDIPPTSNDSTDAGNQLMVSAMPADAGLSLDRGGIGFGAGEGDYLPIVKVAPIFPQRAAMQGIFGTCLVKYTVTAAGTTKDVEVVRDQCVSSVFYRPSVEAALRFKYKPRIIDGVAVEVQDVYNRFHYVNEKDEK